MNILSFTVMKALYWLHTSILCHYFFSPSKNPFFVLKHHFHCGWTGFGRFHSGERNGGMKQSKERSLGCLQTCVTNTSCCPSNCPAPAQPPLASTPFVLLALFRRGLAQLQADWLRLDSNLLERKGGLQTARVFCCFLRAIGIQAWPKRCNWWGAAAHTQKATYF